MSSLPLDLLPKIMQLAAAPGRPYESLDASTLARLCLVSRTFLPIARSILYRDIDASFDDYEPEAEDLPQEGAEATPLVYGTYETSRAHLVYGTYETSRAQRLIVTAHPHLAKLVKAVKIELEGFNREVDASIPPAHTLINLLRKCPNIQYVRVESTFMFEVADTILGRLDSSGVGRDLTSVFITLAGPRCLLLLAQLNHLEKLGLSSPLDIGEDHAERRAIQSAYKLPGSFPFELRSFYVEGFIASNIVRALLADSTHSLARLDISSDELLALRPSLYDFDALATLKLCANRNVKEVDFQRVSDALCSLRSLHTLRLVADGGLPRLPSQLVYLDIGIIESVDPDGLRIMINSCASTLRFLRLPLHGVTPPPALQRVLDVCEQRGVVVVCEEDELRDNEW